MSNKNGSQSTVKSEHFTVEIEVLGNSEYKNTKNINEFLRNSLREFGATYNVLDCTVLEE